LLFESVILDGIKIFAAFAWNCQSVANYFVPFVLFVAGDFGVVGGSGLLCASAVRSVVCSGGWGFAVFAWDGLCGILVYPL